MGPTFTLPTVLYGTMGTESIYFSSTGSASQITVDYSIVDGGEAGITADGSTVNWGTGNLEDDPLFGNQYSLQWGFSRH